MTLARYYLGVQSGAIATDRRTFTAGSDPVIFYVKFGGVQHGRGQ
jgi:hypothetical protein